jgi:hypothetical protein
MKRVGTFACCMLFGVFAAPAGLAQSLSVDWKFYGGASIEVVITTTASTTLGASLKRPRATYGFGQSACGERSWTISM